RLGSQAQHALPRGALSLLTQKRTHYARFRILSADPRTNVHDIAPPPGPSALSIALVEPAGGRFLALFPFRGIRALPFFRAGWRYRRGGPSPAWWATGS